MNVLEIMNTGPVIPVIVVERVEEAVPLARALVDGGVRVLELTLRTPVALRAVETIANEVEGALIGVGTITRPHDFEAARKAGALFGVSPGLTPELVAASRDGGLPLLPGVMTPSEVIAARAAGFTELKLFPAQQAGGVGMLKALAGPFPELNFCPTGGVTPASAPEFLALPNVACVGGSWLTPRDAVAAGDWARIRALAAETSRLREPTC
jgi:2-dehydro-3-deoxyphosphogluconate aldolase/(4S)-4-hydroxy-2-oxoglutarate aldolase